MERPKDQLRPGFSPAHVKELLALQIDEAKRNGVPQCLLDRMLSERISETEINTMFAAARKTSGA